MKSRDAKPACPWSPPRGSFARRPRCSSFRRWLRDAVGLDCPSRSGSVRSGSFLSVCLRVSSVCLRFRSRVGCGLPGGRSSWRTSDQPPPGFSPAPVLMGSQPPVPSSSPRLRRVAFSFFFFVVSPQFDYDVSRRGFFCSHPARDLSNVCLLDCCFSSNLGRFQLSFLQLFFPPLPPLLRGLPSPGCVPTDI